MIAIRLSSGKKASLLLFGRKKPSEKKLLFATF